MQQTHREKVAPTPESGGGTQETENPAPPLELEGFKGTVKDLPPLICFASGQETEEEASHLGHLLSLLPSQGHSPYLSA